MEIFILGIPGLIALIAVIVIPIKLGNIETELSFLNKNLAKYLDNKEKENDK